MEKFNGRILEIRLVFKGKANSDEKVFKQSSEEFDSIDELIDRIWSKDIKSLKGIFKGSCIISVRISELEDSQSSSEGDHNEKDWTLTLQGQPVRVKIDQIESIILAESETETS